jgi:Fe-S cluster biogenesis protein NfuA
MSQITYETTPNPATLKFNFNQNLLDRTLDFTNSQAAERSPLASKIFGFPWTSAVYLGSNFITVTKQDWVDWDVLAEPLAHLISEHIEQGEPLLADIFEPEEESDSNDLPIVKQIKSILNREIRPAVALDGGDVEFAKLEDNILYLKMKGSCSGCPSSKVTLKQGIEVRVKELFPEIKEVVSI